MKRLNQQGLTIVELLVVMSVMIVLSIAVTNFVADNLAASSIATARASLLGDAQQGADKVTNDIRLSTGTDLNNRWPDSYGPGGSQFGWQSGATTLILANAAQDRNANILFQDASQYIPYKNNIIYYLQNGTLYKRILAASVSGNSAVTSCPPASASSTCPADVPILHNVTNLTFSYLDNNNQSVTPTSARSVQVSVTVQSTSFRNPITASYTSLMVFRNG